MGLRVALEARGGYQTMSADLSARDQEEVILLEEWLDAMLGQQWARQRTATKARLSAPMDWVMYLSWLREVVTTWRLSCRGESSAFARRN